MSLFQNPKLLAGLLTFYLTSVAGAGQAAQEGRNVTAEAQHPAAKQGDNPLASDVRLDPEAKALLSLDRFLGSLTASQWDELRAGTLATAHLAPAQVGLLRTSFVSLVNITPRSTLEFRFRTWLMANAKSGRGSALEISPTSAEGGTAKPHEVQGEVRNEQRYSLVAVSDGTATTRSNGLDVAEDVEQGAKWSHARRSVYDRVAKNLGDVWPVSWEDVSRGVQLWQGLSAVQQRRYQKLAAPFPEFVAGGMARLLNGGTDADSASVWFTLDLHFRVHHVGGSTTTISQRIAN